MATTEKYARGAGAATTAAMPAKVDVLTARATPYTGNWVAIQTYDTNFPNDTTSFITGEGLDAEGVNFSPLNTKVSQGDMTTAHFTTITIPIGNTMIIKAYRF